MRTQVRVAIPGVIFALSAIACGNTMGPDEQSARLGPVREITVTPKLVELEAGEAVQFQAKAMNPGGQPVSASPEWSASGGTISASGRYVAGSVAGRFEVMARVGTVSDVAQVSITVPVSSSDSSPESEPDSSEPPPSSDDTDPPSDDSEPSSSSDDPTQLPNDAVSISPGQSIQSVVNAHPVGTTFLLEAGVHRRQTVEPKDGMTFVGEPGAVLDGEGVTRYAFKGNADDVTLRDLEIRNYVPGEQHGALLVYQVSGWVLEDLDVHHNKPFGATLSGDVVVRGGSFHHNAVEGIGLYKPSGAVLDGVELAYNNYQGAGDPDWDAGGIKVVQALKVTIRNCHAHHNNGPGLWVDIDNKGVVLENNLVEDNTRAGIFYEISYSGVIRNNVVRRNGADGRFAGIYVANSSDVEVYGNQLKDNSRGIIIIESNRGSGIYGPRIAADVWVHDNVIDLTNGVTTGFIDVAGDEKVFERNNRFDRNTYYLGKAKPFLARSGTVDENQWRQTGQDINGTFNR